MSRPSREARRVCPVNVSGEDATCSPDVDGRVGVAALGRGTGGVTTFVGVRAGARAGERRGKAEVSVSFALAGRRR